jgi:hypothetical protein
MPLTCADAQARGLGHARIGTSGFEDPHKKPATGVRRARPGPCAGRTRSGRCTPPAGCCQRVAGSAGGVVPGSRAAIVTDQGITVYPARCARDRWRAVWYEPDGSRGQCQSVSQQGLAARLEKVTERLAADAPPKGRKRRRTIHPFETPVGYPLEQMIAVRVAEVRQEQAAGRNPEGIMFPTPTGKYWRSSNFNRRVLKTAFLTAGWRDGAARWTWHSLQHVFCTTALSTWKLDVSDVSRLARHSNTRVAFEMYAGSVVGALEGARQATGSPGR